MKLPRESFENLVQEIFDMLPEQFQENLQNIRIVVEDLPSQETVEKMNLTSQASLLGLYEGIPLGKRGSWYGSHAVVPDKISLYQTNIERGARSEGELRDRVRHVLIHEIAHYYGMSEEEVRKAGY